MVDRSAVQRQVAPAGNSENPAAREAVSATAFRSNSVTSASARRAFWGVFTLKHLLRIQSIPKDPPEAHLGLEGNSASERFIRKLENRVLQKLLDEVDTTHHELAPEVPRIRPEDLTPEYFRESFYLKNQPVIIDGLIKDSKAVRDWKLPWFKQNYGSEVVKVFEDGRRLLTGEFKTPTVPLTIAEAVDRMLAGQPTYINNYNGVFQNHPDLIDQLDPDKIRRYTTAFTRNPTGIHLFMGAKRTGSSLHCASGGNFFCMIHGEKKWTIVHPDFTPYLYPTLHRQGLYAVSAVDALKPLDVLDREGYRLWRNVAKRSVYLREGDVYFNPQWWWHMVENPSETSIGLAFRVAPAGAFAGNPMFALLMMSSPHITKVLLRWLVTRRPARDADVLDRLFPNQSSS
jgi:hypothetical protein